MVSAVFMDWELTVKNAISNAKMPEYEQLKRFRERETDPRKQHKITEEDWRNRVRWDDYKHAVNDMVAHTSTNFAPWTLVAGNYKKFARAQIL